MGRVIGHSALWTLDSLRAVGCSRRPEPIVPEVEWNREAAGGVRAHIVFTIGKHTLTQYDILSSYQPASVSWSSQQLTNFIEPCRRATAHSVQPGHYS